MSKRFTAQEKTIQRALHKVMTEMAVIDYKVIQENGFKITIMFVLKGKDGKPREYRYISDHFPTILENYRAAQLAISRLWDIHHEWHIRTEEGKSSMETILQGFRVIESKQILLAITAGKTPHEVLGVSRDATREEIERAARKLMGDNHPDKGGDAEMFKRIGEAKREMLEAIS